MSESSKCAESKTIAILIYSLSRGGAERFVSYFIKFLNDKGFRIYLILFENKIEYELPENSKVLFLRSSSHNSSGLRKLVELPFLASEYSGLISKLNVDFSFSLLTRPNLVNIFSKLFFRNRSRVIISERAYPSLQYGYGNLQSLINKFLITKFYPYAEIIIGNSFGNTRDLEENFGISKNKLLTIPNPINIEIIDALGGIKDFFDPEYFNLITIGRLDDGKNHQMLIKAIKGLEKVRLYIIGEGPLKTKLVKLIHELNLVENVYLLGKKENPFEYLKSADLFIFGSNHEGFPNVILEGMACGLPILSTNCQSGPAEIMKSELVHKERIKLTDYGILVALNDSQSMKRGIEYFLEHPEFFNNCKLKVQERIKDYSHLSILEEYTNVITS